MGKYKVRVTESAYRDLDRITDYLMERSPAAAYRVYRSLMEAYRSLEIFPLMGPEAWELELRRDHYRKLIVEEYVTLYRFMNNECVIDHIFHGKQDYQGCFVKWAEKSDGE